MNESHVKSTIRSILEGYGFQVDDIPKHKDRKTPDFEVSGNGMKYTIELKVKGDDPEEVLREAEILSHGEVFGKSVPVGYRNRLAAIVRDGVKQLQEYDPHGNSLRILWLHCGGQDPELQYNRSHATLFGTESLVSLDNSSTFTCYYFHDSSFFSHRTILDGVIITFEDKAQLCINTLSPRVDQFRISELVQKMAGGLCDPDTLHGKEQRVMIADCDTERKHTDDVLKYLQKKYDLAHLQAIPLQKLSAKIIPRVDGE